MEFFSITAAKFGIIATLISLYSSMVFVLFFKLVNVRIEKIGILFDYGKTFHRTTIGGIEYKLGWFPGTYVGHHDTFDQFEPDSHLSLRQKPKPVRTLGLFMPVLAALSVLLVAVLFFSGGGLQAPFDIIANTFRALFGSMSSDAYAGYMSNSFAMYGKLPVATLLFTVSLIITGLLNILIYIASFSSSKNANWSGKIVGYGGTLVIAYLLLWKLPVLLFSIVDFTAVLRYAVNALAACFLTGVVAYFVLIGVAGAVNSKPKEERYRTKV